MTAPRPILGCAVEGCDRPRKGREWCSGHYQRWLKRGDVRTGVALQRSMPAESRFWSKVDRRGPDECWPWIGARTARGYGIFYYGKGSPRLASRVAYTFSVGEIPAGLAIRHVVCDNPPCCNPSHLAPGTWAQNAQDKVDHGRQARLKGESSGTAKLTEVKVMEIRELFAAGESKNRLSQQFGVTRRAIKLAVEGQTWGHI